MPKWPAADRMFMRSTTQSELCEWNRYAIGLRIRHAIQTNPAKWECQQECAGKRGISAWANLQCLFGADDPRTPPGNPVACGLAPCSPRPTPISAIKRRGGVPSRSQRDPPRPHSTPAPEERSPISNFRSRRGPVKRRAQSYESPRLCRGIAAQGRPPSRVGAATPSRGRATGFYKPGSVAYCPACQSRPTSSDRAA
jgi:hypothetical protein